MPRTQNTKADSLACSARKQPSFVVHMDQHLPVWFTEYIWVSLCWWQKKKILSLNVFFKILYFHQNNPIVGFLCVKSIARITGSWKRFPNPDSGMKCVYWSENMLIQSYGSVFKTRQCAQPISRIEEPPISYFSEN